MRLPFLFCGLAALTLQLVTTNNPVDEECGAAMIAHWGMVGYLGLPERSESFAMTANPAPGRITTSRWAISGIATNLKQVGVFLRGGLLCALLVWQIGCAREEAGLPEQGVQFWSVPELPVGAELEVDGRAADAELVRGFLLPLWAERWDDLADRAAAERAFYADPRALFEPLVRGVLLLQEAERRWPVLEEQAVAAADAELRRASGAVYDALTQRLGPAGLRAHVERELRKQMLLEAFGAEADPVSEDEVYRRYEEMLAEVDDPAALTRRGVDFAATAPRIRAELELERAVAAQEAWLDARVPQARVRVTVPGGTSVAW